MAKCERIYSPVHVPELTVYVIQTEAAAVEHHDATLVVARIEAEVLAGNADREVVAAIAVEVSRGERCAELVVAIIVFRNTLTVLRPDLIAFVGQPIRRPVDNVDGAGIGAEIETRIFARDTDGEVGEIVAVEVARRQRPAEAVVLFTIAFERAVRAGTRRQCWAPAKVSPLSVPAMT